MKLKFVYSHVLDQLFTDMSLQKYNYNQLTEVSKFIENLNLEWKKYGGKIIKEIEKISGLKFKYDKLHCFVVKNMFYDAISYPFIIKISKNKYILDILIHELIHVILKDDKKLITVLNKFVLVEDSKVHLPVLLIQNKVTENIFDKKRFDKFLDGEASNSLCELWGQIKKDYSDFDKDILGYLKNASR